jgi:hypothetical protein
MRRGELFFDERKMSDDVADVLGAAALLEVAEPELFRIAWRKWHGGEIGDAQLERHYAPYRRRGQVPIWVRHLARRVIADAGADRLNPARYGVTPREPATGMHRRGLRLCLWLAVIVGILLTGAAAVARLLPWHPSCYLPPCH